MSTIQIPKPAIDFFRPPDHLELPDKDGTFVRNFQEHPQSTLLTDSLQSVLRRIHPDEQYCIGQDCGIYWKLTEEPLLGCKAPDWFYVPDVPPLLNGVVRRSFVTWVEGRGPLAAIEYVSGDGAEERDRTPETGKFWVYEQGIRIPYYAIYEVKLSRVEVYHLVDGRYRRLRENARGHFEIEPLGVELGIWNGRFLNMELPWLRWWDMQGNLLPTSEERAEEECRRAEQERRRAEQEHSRAEQEATRAQTAEERAQRLAEKLRALGVNPDET
jgi:Uma2 family endonuclease